LVSATSSDAASVISLRSRVTPSAITRRIGAMNSCHLGIDNSLSPRSVHLRPCRSARSVDLAGKVGLANDASPLTRAAISIIVRGRGYGGRQPGMTHRARAQEKEKMAPTTKEAQRAELHKTIWRIANDLRGSVDGWDFKSYVLGMLFYRFISENLTAYLNKYERDAGDSSFDYAQLGDAQAEFGRKETVEEKGFYILPSELSQNVRKRAANDANLNDTPARVFYNTQ